MKSRCYWSSVSSAVISLAKKTFRLSIRLLSQFDGRLLLVNLWVTQSFIASLALLVRSSTFLEFNMVDTFTQPMKTLSKQASPEHIL